ncbi:MAG: hypothetical protein U0990_10005 [Candidatus Nanopelagicales bacterium]|nr:hypothetical protein [Candidatus Nanopelagicales bacterium]
MATRRKENEMSKMINTLFPGRPDYVGPTSGIFGLLHHDVLIEDSHDVMERVAYVRREKPKREIAVRLHNMIYLSGCNTVLSRAPLYADYRAKCAPLYADYRAKCAPLDADYDAKCAPLDADYDAKCATLYADYDAKCAPLYADYRAKCAPLDAEILIYIKAHIPDCAWDGKQLVFTAAAPSPDGNEEKRK